MNLPPDRTPYWVFEDIKFLGVEGSLDYDRDSTGVTELQVPFIFRRVYKVDNQDAVDSKLEKRAKFIIDTQSYLKSYYKN